MKDRIILLIKAKNLTAAQFADEIGVQKSSISHILSGRNNASLDFIQKVLITYPEVNMEWLMFGKGPLFKSMDSTAQGSTDGTSNAVSPQSSASVDLFSELKPGGRPEFRTEIDLSQQTIPTEKSEPEEIIDVTLPSEKENVEQRANLIFGNPEKAEVSSRHENTYTKTILKIVEFYSDNTYREYFPE